MALPAGHAERADDQARPRLEDRVARRVVAGLHPMVLHSDVLDDDRREVARVHLVCQEAVVDDRHLGGRVRRVQVGLPTSRSGAAVSGGLDPFDRRPACDPHAPERCGEAAAPLTSAGPKATVSVSGAGETSNHAS